ncbi:MAG: Fic family protein [Bacteroidales bacterium]|nr:Fic family protein [Bacteroidales bacterium]MCD8394911.1 Fic family protein [Bacteroidales bacterium]
MEEHPHKISIRFFNNQEVRAAWDEEGQRWLFSVVDVIAVLTRSKNPRNYWKFLKNKLKKENHELVSATNQLKMTAADGKRYLTDCLSQSEMLKLIDVTPSKYAVAFAKWLITGENQLDSKSRDKAYQLWDSSLLASIEVGTTRGLQQIHAYIFGGLYDFAGKIRQKNIAKGGFQFAVSQFLGQTLALIEKMPESTLNEIVEKYVEMNIAHPFMEGNGRSTRIWLDLMLKRSLKRCVDWSQIDKQEYMEAMRESPINDAKIKALIAGALTDRINDREMFMKGIDYSYYYEQND